MRLPDFAALSREQDGILDLPLDSSNIVIGPPGTGKTIMAVYRARMLARSGRPTTLLMFSSLLAGYTQAAARNLDMSASITTYHRWFPQFWRQAYGGDPPAGADRWTFDWERCRETMFRQPPPPATRTHLIIDEGQDMPRDFYLAARLAASHLTVLADENQRITEKQSTIREIMDATGVGAVHTLTRNYRNTRAIASLAATFYTGLRTGIPELPGPENAGELPVLQRHDKLDGEVRQIANYEKTFSDKTIGVLLLYRDQVKRFHNRLKDKTHNQVQGYLNNEAGLPRADFASPGVKLVTWASAKGLEFDTVFLPELQSVPGDPRSDDLRMKLYVLCSRAKSQLFLQYTGVDEPALVRALPEGLLRVRT